MHVHLARLQARDVEQVVHELHEPVRAQEDDLDELPFPVAQRVGAPEQLDEPLYRRERAAQLVGCGGHEVRLDALEPRALGDVPQRPDDSGVLPRAEPRRRDGQRPVVALDGDLAGERILDSRQRAAIGARRRPGAQRRHDLSRARVDGDHRSARVAHHQGVTEALDRRGEIDALGLDARLRDLELLRHRVEGGVQLLQLERAARLHPLGQVAGGELLGGRHEIVEGAADRADQCGDQRERAQQREHPASDGGDQCRA